MPVETKNITDRRQLHFANLDEILAEVGRLAAARNVRTIGNWSFGQILWHLARVKNGSIDGVTIQWTTPPPLIPESIKRRVLSGHMRPGFQLPPDAAKELEPPPTTVAEGLELIRTAIQRQLSETKREPNPFFGPLSFDEWNQLHCRHAELHLSFVCPES